MINLTDEQRQELATQPIEILDPRTNDVYVLVRKDVFDRMRGLQEEYDDSPWTDEEMELLAWEAGKEAGWEDMDEYDRYPEKP